MITMIIFKTARADFSLVAAGLAGLFFKPHGGENAHINSSTTLSTRFPFSKSWGAFWLHVFSIFVKIGCFFYGCWAGRSCGARAFLSGRLGCCGLPGALVYNRRSPRVSEPLNLQNYAPAYNRRISRVSERLNFQNMFLQTTEGFPEYLSH